MYVNTGMWAHPENNRGQYNIVEEVEEPVRLVTVIQPQTGLMGNNKAFIERIYIMFN